MFARLGPPNSKEKGRAIRRSKRKPVPKVDCVRPQSGKRSLVDLSPKPRTISNLHNPHRQRPYLQVTETHGEVQQYRPRKRRRTSTMPRRCVNEGVALNETELDKLNKKQKSASSTAGRVHDEGIGEYLVASQLQARSAIPGSLSTRSEASRRVVVQPQNQECGRLAPRRESPPRCLSTANESSPVSFDKNALFCARNDEHNTPSSKIDDGPRKEASTAEVHCVHKTAGDSQVRRSYRQDLQTGGVSVAHPRTYNIRVSDATFSGTLAKFTELQLKAAAHYRELQAQIRERTSEIQEERYQIWLKQSHKSQLLDDYLSSRTDRALTADEEAEAETMIQSIESAAAKMDKLEEEAKSLSASLELAKQTWMSRVMAAEDIQLQSLHKGGLASEIELSARKGFSHQ